ncbi:2534_t:CDS:2 [Entrophospora sp. SA101]|nr:2534_t:CDS:2 [Entrophospora sp. SA101]CAJ0835534.1 13909_t:CDS:2 [Entrophospora sp. SA101]
MIQLLKALLTFLENNKEELEKLKTTRGVGSKPNESILHTDSESTSSNSKMPLELHGISMICFLASWSTIICFSSSEEEEEKSFILERLASKEMHNKRSTYLGFPEFNSTNNPSRFSSGSTNSNPSDYESYGALDETSSQTYNKASQLLRHVTIKQLDQAEVSDDNSVIKVDGHEIGYITFIAVITSVSSRLSNTEYIMEDGTGLISVKIWQDSADEANAKNDDIKENAYVTVFGNLKALNKDRYVLASRIRPVTDFNEISSYIGRVVFDHLYFTKNVGPRTLLKENYNQGTNNFGTISSYQPESRSSNINTLNLKNPLYKDIIAFVTNNKNDAGTNINQMANALSNKHGSDMIVVNSVEQMCSDGLLYSTVD